MMDYQLTLAHVLDRMSALFADRTVATREPDGSVTLTTYGRVQERSRKLAAALTHLGIRSGEPVGTLSWNHAAHLEAYFGVPCSGAILHTINPRLHIDDLRYIVATAGDRALIVDESLLGLVEQLPEAERPDVVIVNGEVPEGLAGAVGYEELLASVVGDSPLPEIREHDPAAMCFTSATTGRPKGVVYSHRSLLLHSVVSAMPDEFDLSGHDVIMPVVPMFHVNAWGLPYTAALVGARLVLPGQRLDAESLLDLIDREKVTFAAGVPTIWNRVLDAIESDDVAPSLASLRTVLVGGSAATPSLITAIDELGPRVLHAWGMTETSPLGSVSRIKPGLELTGAEELRLRATQGVAAPLVDLRGVSEGAEVPRDGVTPGELQVRGPWITGQYLGGVDQDKFTDDGWFRTGDMAVIDEAGYASIVDRLGDLIKSGGEWISSLDLEAAIMERPEIAQVAVIARPDSTWGERPVAYVVCRTPIEADVIRSHLGQQFAKWQIPEDFIVVDELPMTATGKISKARLRASDVDPRRKA